LEVRADSRISRRRLPPSQISELGALGPIYAWRLSKGVGRQNFMQVDQLLWELHKFSIIKMAAATITYISELVELLTLVTKEGR
jgi:hypothetical protein